MLYAVGGGLPSLCVDEKNRSFPFENPLPLSTRIVLVSDLPMVLIALFTDTLGIPLDMLLAWNKLSLLLNSTAVLGVIEVIVTFLMRLPY
jgi:hypothetical protein